MVNLSVYPSVLLGSGPKGVDDLCFHTYMGNFLLLLLLLLRPPPHRFEAQILVPRPKSQSLGPNPIQKAQILASRPKS